MNEVEVAHGSACQVVNFQSHYRQRVKPLVIPGKEPEALQDRLLACRRFRATEKSNFRLVAAVIPSICHRRHPRMLPGNVKSQLKQYVCLAMTCLVVQAILSSPKNLEPSPL